MEDNYTTPPIPVNQKVNGIPTNKIWYYRLAYAICVLVLGFLSTLNSHSYAITTNSFFYTFIPTALGAAIGYAIFSIIIGIVRYFLKKPPTINIYVIYTTISFIMFFLGLQHSERLNKNESYLNKNLITEKNSNEKHNDGFEFSCTDNEYAVTFATVPKIIDGSTPIGDEFIKSQIAELFFKQNHSLCRAECAYLGKSLVDLVDEDYVYKFLKEYSNFTGFFHPNFNYEESSLGKIGTLRAFKKLENSNNQEIIFTFVVKVYFGKESMMILYTGCVSEDYPTRNISNFLGSIKRI